MVVLSFYFHVSHRRDSEKEKLRKEKEKPQRVRKSEKGERQKDEKTERQKDRKTERQKERKKESAFNRRRCRPSAAESICRPTADPSPASAEGHSIVTFDDINKL